MLLPIDRFRIVKYKDEESTIEVLLTSVSNVFSAGKSKKHYEILVAYPFSGSVEVHYRDLTIRFKELIHWKSLLFTCQTSKRKQKYLNQAF